MYCRVDLHNNVISIFLHLSVCLALALVWSLTRDYDVLIRGEFFRQLPGILSWTWITEAACQSLVTHKLCLRIPFRWFYGDFLNNYYHKRWLLSKCFDGRAKSTLIYLPGEVHSFYASRLAGCPAILLTTCSVSPFFSIWESAWAIRHSSDSLISCLGSDVLTFYTSSSIVILFKQIIQWIKCSID